MSKTNKLILTLLFCLFLSFIIFTGCIEDSSQVQIPNVVFVDDDYDSTTSGWNFDHFKLIQAGIENVSEGGIVFVNNGIYYENIIIDKSLMLIGEDKNITIIDGNRSGDVLNIEAENCTVQNFSFINGVQSGVKINSYGNTLTNNIFNNNSYGIQIYYISNNNIINNIITNNQYGMGLRMSSYNLIKSNYIFSNKIDGITLDSSENETILNNNFQDTGITISGSFFSLNTHVIENNTADNGSIYYYKNENGITISSNAKQIILVNCSDIQIKKFNFGEVITAIQIHYCSNILIENNNFSSTIQNAIKLSNSNDNSINMNTFTCENSIELDDSNNNNIWQNTLGSSDIAIKMTNSKFNNISENNIFSNEEYGLYFQSSSNNNTVTRNHIFNNHIGFRIKGSKYNEVYKNELKDNSYIGLYICCGAQDNTIHQNSFITNDKHVDYTIYNTNYMYKDTLGNYWDDYMDRYPNSSQLNGVWDTPYLIPGSTFQDKYPLVNTIDI